MAKKPMKRETMKQFVGSAADKRVDRATLKKINAKRAKANAERK